MLLNIMISGECHLEQESRRARLGPGDLCIYESVRPYEITTPGEFEVLVVMADRPMVETALGNLRLFTGCSIDHSAPTATIAGQYWHNLSTHAVGLTDSELKAFVMTGFDILRTAFGSVPFSDRGQTAAATLSLQRAKMFMKNNFHRPTLSSDEIAQATGLSLRRLQELFQGEGLTIMGYLQMLRLEAARRYLGDSILSRMSVASVMERVGFADQSHFSRAFRRAYGQNPRAWRQAHCLPTRKIDLID